MKPAKGSPRVSLQAVATLATGFDGHIRTGDKRQILLISGSVLNELGLEPGEIFENVVVDDMDVMALPSGQRLRLGDALVEVTIPCEPCVQMDRVRHGLQAALHDRRGMFVKVVTPGPVHVGDPVEVLWRESVADNSLR